MKPNTRPANPSFLLRSLRQASWLVARTRSKTRCSGRSHRAKPGKAKLKEVVDRSRAILGIPNDYRVGIVPASDTGAVEMALWSLLGRARRRRAGLGEFRRRLGHRHRASS